MQCGVFFLFERFAAFKYLLGEEFAHAFFFFVRRKEETCAGFSLSIHSVGVEIISPPDFERKSPQFVLTD